MINTIRIISITIAALLCFAGYAPASGYTFEGRNLEDYPGNKNEVRISSTREMDEENTAVIWFDQKEIKVEWGKIDIDPDKLVEGKIQPYNNNIGTPDLNINFFKVFKDEKGVRGDLNTHDFNIISEDFSFKKTSFVVLGKVLIKAEDSCPSIIRSLESSIAPFKKFVLVHGGVDFRKKDNNFTGIGEIPGLLISGIYQVDIIFDRSKLDSISKGTAS